jgi:hypothetical protein
MNWQEKDVLIIDEISILEARTLYAVNEQLCIFRRCTHEFGGIPIVSFLETSSNSGQCRSAVFCCPATNSLGTKVRHSKLNKGINTIKLTCFENGSQRL